MTNDVTAQMFAAVLLGQPRYFYTAEPRNPVVNIHRIVRDGANRLWLSTQYGGVPVEEASVTVLGPVPEYSNLADERASQAEAEGHRLKARVLELEAENRKCCVHSASLRARVAELEALNEHLDEESGQRDCAALEAEVERLKAHTWETERAAVVKFLDKQKNPLRSSVYFAGKIERGDHWPEGGAP